MKEVDYYNNTFSILQNKSKERNDKAKKYLDMIDNSDMLHVW